MSSTLSSVSDPRACGVLLTRMHEMFGFLPNSDVPVSYAVAMMRDDFWDVEKVVTEFLIPWLKEFVSAAYYDFTCLPYTMQGEVLSGEYDWSSGKTMLDLFLSSCALSSRLTDAIDSAGVSRASSTLYLSAVDTSRAWKRFSDLRTRLKFSVDETTSYSGVEDKFDLFKGFAYHYMYTILFVLSFAANKVDHGVAETDPDFEVDALGYFNNVLSVYASVVNKYRTLNPDSEVLERLGQL